MKSFKKIFHFSRIFLLTFTLCGLVQKTIAMPPAPNRENGCSNTTMQTIITETSNVSIDNFISGYNTIFLVGDAVYQQHSPGSIYDYGGTIKVHLIPDNIEYYDLISNEEGPHELGRPIIRFKNDDFDFEKYKIGSIPSDIFYTKIGNRSASWYEEQCAEINENTKIVNYHYIIEKAGSNYNLDLTSIKESGGLGNPILYINIDGYPAIKNIPRITTFFISIFLFLFLGINLEKKDENIKNKIIRLCSGLTLFITLNFVNINFVNINLVNTIFTKFKVSSLVCLSLGLFFSLVKNILIFKYILSIKRKYTILLSIFFSIIEISSLLYLFHILQIIKL